VIDSNLNLLGNAYKIGEIEQAGQFRNFKNVNGVRLPFTEETYRAGQSNLIRYTRYQVNAPMKTNWRKPVARPLLQELKQP
jgi:hypothetical protein